jgi:hypothetical protein
LATTDAATALKDGSMAGLCDWLRGKFNDLPDLTPGLEGAA